MQERFAPIDFEHFHAVVLPEKLGSRPSADLGGLRPIAFRMPDGAAYTYAASGSRIAVEAGDAGASTVVELDPRSWSDFVCELRSSFSLLYAGDATFERGGMGDLAQWEPVLRVVLDGQAMYDLAAPPPLQDGDGEPLVLDRSFGLEDSDDEMRSFLQVAGFVHLRSVFGANEIEAMREVVRAAVARARPDDQRSWWTTVGSREVCNRVIYLNEQSELVAALGSDRRMRRIADLGGRELRDATDRLDGDSVVIKVPGAQTGLADLPWHRDCGMGGHPVMCPVLNVGIQLDAASPANGQLLMIAGSHKGTSRLPTDEETKSLPVAALRTRPGDVTAHFGHTLHSAPPPSDLGAPGRRALYVTFVQPRTFEMVGPGEGYNDVLFSRDAGRVPHVDDLR